VPAREVEAPQTGPRLVQPSPADSDESLATEGTGEAQERAGTDESGSFEETEDMRELLRGPDRMEEGQAPWQRRQPQAASRREAEARAGEYPGFSEIALEIALGALRLTRTLLTAPLRLALALLRPREA
jgi:hypothetical protein